MTFFVRRRLREMTFGHRRSVAVLLLALATTVSASAVGAQVPTRFDSGIVAGGEWLQANSLPLDRDVMPSAAFSIGLRRQSWMFDAGFLRIARTLSTVQGGTVSVGRVFRWKRVLFIPTANVLGGEALASRDSTGYDFVAPGGVTGRVPGYFYSDGVTFGGGAGLTVEVPAYRMVAFRVTASQWYFSGHPLDGDRARTVVGAGLSLRVHP